MDPVLLHLPKLLLLGEAGQMPVLTLGQWPLVVTIPSAVLRGHTTPDSVTSMVLSTYSKHR